MRGRLGGHLRGHVVDAADERARRRVERVALQICIILHKSQLPTHTHLIHVPVGVVDAEGLVDGRAFGHELHRAAGVGRDVAYGDKSAKHARK